MSGRVGEAALEPERVMLWMGSRSWELCLPGMTIPCEIAWGWELVLCQLAYESSQKRRYRYTRINIAYTVRLA